jgi:type I restriction enzyme R subunit
VDKRLAGITAVQTLSRLNRAHDGKDTTYVVDFVNDPEEILTAFKTYYDTAELADVTDPHLVFDLRMKLDALGFYDEFEVNRVVEVEFNPKAKQSDLAAAVEPVVSRLLLRYKSAQERLKIATVRNDGKAPEDAKNELNALVLFKHDMSVFQRMYAFLAQIFDYGNTAIEKRFIFYKRLLPLLEFGREREGIDLSKVTLTHHHLKDQGKRTIPLGERDSPKLSPLLESGGGSVQEKEKARLAKIIAKVNDLFEGDLTEDDRLVYVNNAIKGKLLRSLDQSTVPHPNDFGGKDENRNGANSILPNASNSTGHAILPYAQAASSRSGKAWRCVWNRDCFRAFDLENAGRRSFLRRR